MRRRASLALAVGALLVPALAFVQVGRRPRRPIMTVASSKVGIRGNIAFEITQVLPESAAAKAGLQPNDLLLAIDGKTILSGDDVRGSLLDPFLPQGKVFTLKVARLDPATHEYAISEIRVRSE
jgi:membrane-associated protease RseP (regulator of RpoE activity)